MRILLGGFGVVGQALVRMLDQRRADLYRERGLQPRLVGVFDTLGAAISEVGLNIEDLLAAKKNAGSVGALPGHGVDWTQNDRPKSIGGGILTRAESLIADSDADVFVLATPTQLSPFRTGPAPAIDLIKAAFRHSMHVVCVNKAPLAVAMPGLLELANYNRRQLRFSGTVGAGTPFLQWARQCAAGDTITCMQAILNGTTNFILWKMMQESQSFDAALTEAQRLGYAETDPGADVDGIDTAVKVVIFANHVLCGTSGRRNAGLATLEDVNTKGIRDVSQNDIDEARRRGNVVKLIGKIEGSGEKLNELSVQPREISANDPLNVVGSLNAVTLSLKHSGDTTLIGRGAGGAETATAIVRDLLDIWDVMGHHT